MGTLVLVLTLEEIGLRPIHCRRMFEEDLDTKSIFLLPSFLAYISVNEKGWILLSGIILEFFSKLRNRLF